MTPHGNDPDLPVSVQEVPAEVWGQRWTAARLGALSVAECAQDLLKEVDIVFIAASIVWSQVKNSEGTQRHPSTENWIKYLLSMVPSIRTRLSFPLSQSFPLGSFSKPIILLHQKADRMKITITEK